MRSRAEIRRIADTWGNGKDRKAALARLEQLRTQSKRSKSKKDPNAISFVINDRTTYTSVSQFRADDNDVLFREYQNTLRQIEELKLSLEKSRNYYIKAKSQDRDILKKEILDSECQYEKKLKDVKSLEKRIRNAENAYLQNK